MIFIPITTFLRLKAVSLHFLKKDEELRNSVALDDKHILLKKFFL